MLRPPGAATEAFTPPLLRRFVRLKNATNSKRTATRTWRGMRASCVWLNLVRKRKRKIFRKRGVDAEGRMWASITSVYSRRARAVSFLLFSFLHELRIPTPTESWKQPCLRRWFPRRRRRVADRPEVLREAPIVTAARTSQTKQAADDYRRGDEETRRRGDEGAAPANQRPLRPLFTCWVIAARRGRRASFRLHEEEEEDQEHMFMEEKLLLLLFLLSTSHPPSLTTSSAPSPPSFFSSSCPTTTSPTSFFSSFFLLLLLSYYYFSYFFLLLLLPSPPLVLLLLLLLLSSPPSFFFFFSCPTTSPTSFFSSFFLLLLLLSYYYFSYFFLLLLLPLLLPTVLLLLLSNLKQF